MARRSPDREAPTSCHKVSKDLQRDHDEAQRWSVWKSAKSSHSHLQAFALAGPPV